MFNKRILAEIKEQGVPKDDILDCSSMGFKEAMSV